MTRRADGKERTDGQRHADSDAEPSWVPQE
jgi:hypothetical protein